MDKGSELNLRQLLNNYCFGSHLETTDENTFFFAKEQRWDTSFLIMLHKDSTKFRGIYYETNPTNALLSDSEKEIHFYEGLNFEIDAATWDQVISESKRILAHPNHEFERRCVDCETYVLFYNGEQTTNKTETTEQFINYATLIRRLTVDPVIKHKQEMLKEVYPDMYNKNSASK